MWCNNARKVLVEWRKARKGAKKRNTKGILRGCNIGHRRGGAKKKPRAFDDQVVLCSFDYQVARKL